MYEGISGACSVEFRLVRCICLLAASSAAGVPAAQAADVINISDGAFHSIENQSLTEKIFSISNSGTNVTFHQVDIEKGSIQVLWGGSAEINNTEIQHDGSVNSSTSPLFIQGQNYNSGTITTVTGNKVSIDSGSLGIDQKGYSNVTLTEVDITSGHNGININGSLGTSIIDFHDFSITSTERQGVNAGFGAEVNLTNGTINTSADGGYGVYLYGKGYNDKKTTASMKNVTVHTTGSGAHALYSEQNGNNGADSDWHASHLITEGTGAHGVLAWYSGNNIKFTGSSSITTKGDDAFGIYSLGNAYVALNDTSVTTSGTNAYGAVVQAAGRLDLINSSIQTQGLGADGMYMHKGLVLGLNPKVNLSGSRVTSAQGYGISAKGGILNMTVSAGSVVSGTAGLMQVQEWTSDNTQGATTVNLVADDSTLIGRVLTADNTIANISLQNNAIWQIDGDANLTTLSNSGSIVRFMPSGVSGVFHTLRVGDGNSSSTAYYIGNGATLQMNTRLNEGGALANQQTDRLLINGDVSGTTQVQVVGVAGSPWAATSPDGGNYANEGISLIQVAGSATASSFKLAGDYVTLNGKPYQYGLYAYGPDSENGVADVDQRLVAGTSSHWDYRLQSRLTDREDDQPTWQVAPQVPAYLVAPIVLFDAGLQDISSLHSRLGEIRRDGLAGDGADTGEFFMRAYGAAHDYASNRSTSKYGYDADLDYSAVQLGGNLFALQSSSGMTRFGLAGARGSLSYRPKRVADAGSGSFTTWSVAAYATYQHASGGFVDGVVSVGGFDGDVSTRLRGNTASLKGKSFSASLEMGYPFALEGGFALEPHAQLIYQRLSFDSKTDVDGFAVDIGDQDQVTGRLGVRLSRGFPFRGDGLLTAYVKLGVLHGFSSGGSVFLGDTFALGRYGTGGEGRLGIDAKFSKQLSFHADVGYLHEIGNNGVRGASLNGGLRYIF